MLLVAVDPMVTIVCRDPNDVSELILKRRPSTLDELWVMKCDLERVLIIEGALEPSLIKVSTFDPKCIASLCSHVVVRRRDRMNDRLIDQEIGHSV